MGLSGSLREFHLSEIVQLLSSQKKTGCLTLDQKGEEAYLHFEEGRLVAVRDPGLKPNDPLMRFLKRVHWLSQEQLHGIETLHTESGRDLLDILLNGRYLDSEELTILYERMSIQASSRWARAPLPSPWRISTGTRSPTSRLPTSPAGT